MDSPIRPRKVAIQAIKKRAKIRLTEHVRNPSLAVPFGTDGGRNIALDAPVIAGHRHIGAQVYHKLVSGEGAGGDAAAARARGEEGQEREIRLGEAVPSEAGDGGKYRAVEDAVVGYIQRPVPVGLRSRVTALAAERGLELPAEEAVPGEEVALRGISLLYRAWKRIFEFSG